MKRVWITVIAAVATTTTVVVGCGHPIDGVKTAQLKSISPRDVNRARAGHTIFAKNFPWLSGTWVSRDNPVETIEVAEDFSRISRTFLTNVGSTENEDVPFPALCDLRYSAASFRVLQADDGSGVYRLQLYVDRVEVVSDARNAPDCGKFADEQKAKILQGNLPRIDMDLLREDESTLSVVGVDTLERFSRKKPSKF